MSEEDNLNGKELQNSHIEILDPLEQIDLIGNEKNDVKVLPITHNNENGIVKTLGETEFHISHGIHKTGSHPVLQILTEV